MLKKLMMATATTALLAGSAVAQDTTTNRTTTTPNFISEQSSNQWLASNFKGTDVIGTNNEKIGDVTDILFSNTGRVDAYVIGIGGFLGIGTKDVALPPTAFQVQPPTDRDNMKLRLSMTKDELKNAPEFKARKNTNATTNTNTNNTTTTTTTTTTPTTTPTNPR